MVTRRSYRIEPSWPWPFSRADLTAGLRRHIQDASLRLVEVRPLTMTHRRPAIGRIRGVLVKYQTASGEGSCRLVVKEPRGSTRTGLAGAGRREVGVYRSLASQLPLPGPSLIAASPLGDWLLMEAIPVARDADAWRAEDYKRAISALVRLHDRFWRLGEDLDAYPWLSRPLEADFHVHVTAAAKAIQRMVERGRPEPLVGSPDRMRVLALLTTHADQVVAPLRRQPSTLLHGDYWPGNIAVLEDGRQLVYDWQLAGVGPGVIDLLVFVNKSRWWFEELPLSEGEIVSQYRQEVARLVDVRWDEATWEELWDHALMWRFLQEWTDLLIASPEALLEARAEQLDQVWLEPLAEAVRRRLGSG
jgi:hypothetical protein